MNEWYQSLASSQKIFLFSVSIAASFVLVGIPFLLFLIYMEIGNRSLGQQDFQVTFNEHKRNLMQNIQEVESLTEFLRNHFVSIWGIENELAESLARFLVLRKNVADSASENKDSALDQPLFMHSTWFEVLKEDLHALYMLSTRYRRLTQDASPRAARSSIEELVGLQRDSKLDTWYRDSVSPSQKIFLFAASIIFSPFLIGIPLLILLIHLELGRRSIDSLNSMAYRLEDEGTAIRFEGDKEIIEWPIDFYISRNGEPKISKRKALALQKEYLNQAARELSQI